ncbi:MAG: energy-coupling factor ABC transporter ATP-binding protein [Candidatus Thorarchaeota archaeon]
MDFLIQFENVSFEYPEKTFGIHDVSFNILAGKKYALCGRNGAGKTTLLRLLMGLETPDTGSIKVENLLLNRKNVKLIRQRIGFVFQNPDSQVFSASVFEDVAFGPRNMGLKEEEVKARVQKALESVDLVEYADRSPYQMSYGQKKRVAIAGILVMDPAIIVLDEPFSNLDYPSRVSLRELLEREVIEKGKTILFASHSRKLIHEWADYVFFLDEGKILYSGETKGLVDIPLVEKYLGPI